MFFTVTFYISLSVCLLGVGYRIWNWFRIKIGPETKNISVFHRITAVAKGIGAQLFSLRILLLLKVFVIDVIFQIKILKEDYVRWLMHMSIFAGFMLLLFMHALDDQITRALFPDYASTLNPFFFLRNFFGVLVVLGVGVALMRRIFNNNLRLTTNTGDRYAIIILAVIIISGFMLEGVKIISSPVFDQMVEDYAGIEEPDEILPLKVYWAEKYGVSFSDLTGTPDADMLQEGMELHEESCADCHSSPVSAFISYPLSKAVKPIAGILNRARVDVWLLYIHFLSCFIGLAYLPFSKFFHIISSPVSLLVNGSTGKIINNPANTATRRAMELDACTHCSTCTLHCSVEPVFRIISNKNILPSEKLISLKSLAGGKKLGFDALQSLQEGCFICTGCYRCTTLCPVDINLQDLWIAFKEDLDEKSFPEPAAWARKTIIEKSVFEIDDKIEPLYPATKLFNLSKQAETFSFCFGCQTCTNVCPVVANYENPIEALDFTPHQIMYSLGLGLREIALGSRMIWDCTTCYLCQEYCPQGVQVTDILFEMKNLAYKQLKTSVRREETKNLV